MKEVEIMEEEVVDKPECDSHSDSSSKKGNSSTRKKSGKVDESQSASTKSVSPGRLKKASRLQLDCEASSKSSPKGKSPPEIPPTDKRNDKSLKKQNAGVTHVKKQRNLPLGGSKSQNGSQGLTDSDLANPDLGPFYLSKQGIDFFGG
ncbi:hypothetical protein SLA2020_440290 [Shorea laevis]